MRLGMSWRRRRQDVLSDRRIGFDQFQEWLNKNFGIDLTEEKKDDTRPE